MNCPFCGTLGAKSLKATYLENTTVSYSEGTTSGLTFELGKLPSIGRGKSKGVSVTQNKLAQICAPPPKPDENLLARVLTIAGFSLFLAYAVNSKNFSEGWFFFCLFLFGLPLALLDSWAQGKKEDAYDELKYDWDRRWICSTCLRRWIPRNLENA